MLIKTILIAAVGALVCLDRSCLQVLISRPIVAAPLVGLVLGSTETGLVIGAFLELLWVDRPALGNYIPPNDSVTAVVITSATILSGPEVGGISRNLPIFAILVLLPVSYLTQKIDAFLVAGNNAVSDAALEAAKRGDAAGIERRHLLALAKSGIVYAVVIFLFTTLGTLLMIYLFPLLPPPALRALRLVHFIFPILIVAGALQATKLKRNTTVFCSLFAICILLREMFHVF